MSGRGSQERGLVRELVGRKRSRRNRNRDVVVIVVIFIGI